MVYWGELEFRKESDYIRFVKLEFSFGGLDKEVIVWLEKIGGVWRYEDI